MKSPSIALFLLVPVWGCQAPEPRESEAGRTPAPTERLSRYANVRLKSDLSDLAPSTRQALSLLIEAAEEMDQLFLEQSFAGRQDVDLGALDRDTLRLLEVNYGPWDRLSDNAPFVEGVGPKPLGANFYPLDMTKEEFERHVDAHPEHASEFKSLYTVIRRDNEGRLVARPYRVHYRERLQAARTKLMEAARLVDDPGLKRYLMLRARALVTDEYQPSDMAWMDMKTNPIDVVIGPVETYEDRLFGYKAAFTAYVLIKDLEWSERLSKYARLLPELQAALPVPDEYKTETPGSDSDLNAYDVVFYAGDCNAGPKTIAINLPNDEEVQLTKGSRRLQLKNAMRAKFDKILRPIAAVLIEETQRRHVTFDAFFENVMFHEVAHGLGVKHTINGRGTVREALKDRASALEEGKADVLGLYMVSRLRQEGHLAQGTLMDNYVTFLASIFRSIRFGAASAHGRANLLRFNFFRDMGAFSRDPARGTYRVDPEKMEEAVRALSARILRIQGDGDYGAARRLVEEHGEIGAELEDDISRVGAAGIPVDVVFEQGIDVLGL